MAQKSRITVFVFCFILSISLFVSPLYAQSQRIIPLGSEVYDELDSLYLLRGLGTPSTARPWTASEAQLILERIDSKSLSPGEQELYDAVAAEIFRNLRFSFDNAISLDTKLDLALEAYAHTNSKDFVLSDDWNYGYEERKPPARLSLEMNFSSWFYIFTDMEYNRNRFNDRDDFRTVNDLAPNVGIGAETSFSSPYLFPWRSWAYSKSFITNIPAGTDEFDFDWPKRADIVFGGQHWNLSLARDRIQWGRGNTGNFVFDGHRDYDEYFRFSAYSDRFKYEWLNVFYPASQAGGSLKFFMAHRLEFRFLPSLVFVVSENVMCSSDNFNPRYINPAFIYHQWYDRDDLNSLAHLELDFVPFKGYRLYTQAVFDQIRAPWEDMSEPASWGLLAGIEHVRPAFSGTLSLSLEGAYTTPLLYRRDLVDFITLGVTNVNNVGDVLNMDYTGYPYGGDAMVLQFDANCRFPGSALIHARLFGMIHGKMNFFVSHNIGGDNTGLANLTTGTPSGSDDEREYTFGASLGGNYLIPQPVSAFKLSAWAEVDYFYITNKLMISATGTGTDIIYHEKGGTSDFQFVAGIGMQF